MAIRRIDKAYFPLEDVVSEWQLPKSDLLYVVETGQLRLSYRATRLRLELGEYEEIEPDHYQPCVMKDVVHSGLVDLHASDARIILAKGKAPVKSFHVPHPAFQIVDSPERMIEVEKGDLLITKAEKVRFEAENATDAPGGTRQLKRLHHSQTYSEVMVGDVRFSFGPMQARIIKALHKAARDGSPWLNGKVLLGASGSSSLRLSDLFKSQPRWRDLIQSDRKGLYRIHSSIMID